MLYGTSVIKTLVWNIVVLLLWACTRKEHSLQQTHVQNK